MELSFDNLLIVVVAGFAAPLALGLFPRLVTVLIFPVTALGLLGSGPRRAGA